jgi:glycosyltransferase involved in cell wall biosynthesis
MKITFVVAAPDLSGGFRVIVDYAKRLSSRGHSVLIVCPPPRQPTLRDYLRSLYRSRPWPKVVGSHLDNSNVPHRFLERNRPVSERDVPDADVIIATWWETVNWVREFGPSKGAKVHLVQGYESFHNNKEEVDSVLRLSIPKITISGYLDRLIRDEFHQKSLACITNAADHDLFYADPRSKNSVSKFGFIFSPLEIKGSDVIVEAIRMAQERCPALQAVAFGHELPSRELNWPDYIEFIRDPAQARLRQIYSSCDAWLWGSRLEGFGLPILEAMACRTPVIATPAGAAPELLANGGGYLVEMASPESMAEKIAEVAALDDSEWRRISDQAHHTATSYTWDDAAERMEAALERLLASSKAT